MKTILGYLKSQSVIVTCTVLTVALLVMTPLLASFPATASYLAQDPPLAPLPEEPNLPLRDVIAEKLKTQDKVKLELFVMSQCPFGVRAEQALAPILKEFGDKINFTLYFIASEEGNGGFRSLHGQPEVEEDIRQVVMARYYPDRYFDYVLARADNYQSDEWEQQAAALGIDSAKVSEIASSAEGKALFRENIKKGKELGIGASPTLLIDDEKYTGRISPFPAASAGCTVPPWAYNCICPGGGHTGRKQSNYVKTPDGCSNPLAFTEEGKNNPTGKCSFKEACDRHDCCYGTCNSGQHYCDTAFHEDMIAACYQCAAEMEENLRNEFLTECNSAADLYYYGVVAGGWVYPYPNNQADACENCCCDDYGCPEDGWQCSESTDVNTYFDHYCSTADWYCRFTHTMRNCNDYDGWHCAGGGQKRQKWDGYCQQGSLLVCDYNVLEEEDCNDYDNYFCVGDERFLEDWGCVDGQCEFVGLKYGEDCNYYDGLWRFCIGDQVWSKDYGCVDGGCVWVDSDFVKNCNDDDVCGKDGQDCSCVSGTCGCVDLVALASFTATSYDGYVLVEWETASEIDTAGFNVWRSQAEDGQYIKLNAALIPPQGSPISGASYSYVDDTVTNGVTYYYKLEDVDTRGISTFHGPVSARPARIFRIYLPLVFKQW